MDYKFIIKKTNKFGEPQYVESQRGKNIGNMPVWVVKNPSSGCVKWLLQKYRGSDVRYYNNVKFVMSAKAQEVIPEENSGGSSGVVVRFTYENNAYYAMVTDNKEYVQFCHGSAENNEEPIETALRELEEELGIVAEPQELYYVGNFSYTNYDPLVEYNRESVTSMFYIDLPFDRVEHLFPQGVGSGPITIIDVKLLPFSLHEINYVVALKESELDLLPEYINEIQIQKKINGRMRSYPCKLSGHNVEFLRRLVGLPPKYNVSYLHSFNVFE